MSLSFEDSLKNITANNMATTKNENIVAPAVMSVEDMSLDSPSIMTLDAAPMMMAAYSGDDGSWQQHNGYAYYATFSDDNVSTISATKDIKLDGSQFNITQEENSQYIPFEMNRYYDGYDLVDALLSIHYETKTGRHGAVKPINVTYNNGNGDPNNAKIRFGWLVDAGATLDAGTLGFEIHAYGSVTGIDEDGKSVTNSYTWKTKPNKTLNVLQSLCDCESVVNNIDDTWMQTLVEDVAFAVAEKIADAQVGVQVNEAKAAAAEAKAAADSAEQTVANALNGYATEEYVQTEIGKVDVSEQLQEYAKTEDVETLVGDIGESGNVVGYVDTTVGALSEKFGNLVDENSNPLTVEAYVNKKVEEVDVSDQIGDLGADDEGNLITTVVAYVDKKVNEVDVSEQLENYYTKSETYTKEEVNAAVGNVKVDLTGYATTDALEAVRGNTVTNANNITTVQNDIATIKSSLSSLEGDNENLIVQYDEVGSILHLYEKDENGDITITDGDKQIKVKEISSTIITGAGGNGSSLVSTIKLNLSADGEEYSTILFGNTAFLNYNLSTRKAKETQDEEGNDVTIYEEAVIAGDITFTLYRDNVYQTHFTVTKTSSEVQSDSVDISDYIALGKHVYTIKASYIEQLGSDGETVTVRSSADWTIDAVKLDIELDEKYLEGGVWETTPKYGSAEFLYTPIGTPEKTIYFKIDDEEPDRVVTSLNGTSLPYTIPMQTHGVHTLQVWCEANVGGKVIPTEPYKYVLMFVEAGNEAPIIRMKAPTTLKQYSSDYIYYNVLDPLSPIIDSVSICDEDGVVLSTVTNITSAERKFEFRPSVVKDKTITIKYKETTESVTIKVTPFPYPINAVTGNLMVDFVPTGRTNSDLDYNVFKNSAYTTEGEEIPITWDFSDNFDWINGGWKTDENNDTYFCVKAGTSVDINYNLFGTDGVVAKKDAYGEYTIAGTGKEFKLIFKTTNVAQANATWLQCVDVADKKSLGLRMKAQNAYIDSGLGTLEIPYVDNDIIEFDMNIVPITDFNEDGTPNLNVKAIPMIMTYEDGTPVQPKVISSASTSFKQDEPKPITIGSEYCDVHIYRMKVYERYLEDKEIITNFIADARSGVEMAKRYVKNDIYPIDNKQKITPESVAAACPDLKVYVLSAPYFTNDKGNKVENTTIKQIHNTGTKEKPEYDASENWTATGATHNGQGTSSNEYGYSGRNLEFNMKKATITLNDNVTVVKEIQLSPTSYPTNYLNFKINIASSENANNALLQKRYDRYLPYTSIASLIDDRKKNSMEFFNCVVFIQETDTTQDENGNYTSHREFNDTDIHFYGIGNIGDSKKTDNSRVNDVDDSNEFCVEIMDWNRYLSSFPADTMVSTLYIDDDGNQVLRFENLLVDTNLGENGIIYEKDSQGNYCHSTDTTIDKTKTYYIDILENDDFSEDYTYGFRYIQSKWDEKDDPDYKQKNEAFQKPLREKWIEFYRFVTRDLTTNGAEDTEKVKDWKSEFSNWFITDSALYYYLYTLRYTMVDNRAKNSFWHWAKHYLTFEEAMERGIALYDEDKNLITDTLNPPNRFYDVNGKEIKNINAAAAAINDGYRMEFWAYDNDTALGIDNAGKLEIPVGVEDDDVDFAGVPYFRAHDSLVFVRIAKYFAEELENAWHNTEINPVGKAFDSTNFIKEFDEWQNEFPEELWRLDYERKYKRTYVGGTGKDWDNALPQSNKSDIVSTRFLTEMMNGRKKYQRRCFERNQEIYMSSKFKGEVNLSDTITLRGTGRPTGKAVPFSSTLNNIVPFSKMYVNLYSATDKIYYHKKHEAGEKIDSIPYPETTLDFIYIRGASQMQSLGNLSPMYLQTAELTSGAKLKTITLGNATDGYSNDSLQTLQIGAGNKLLEELDIRNLSNLNNTVLPVTQIPSLKRVYAQGSNISEAVFANNGLLEEAYLPETLTRLELRNLHYLKTIDLESYDNLLHLVVMDCSDMMNNLVLDMINQATDLQTLRVTNVDWTFDNTTVLERLYSLIKTPDSPEVILTGKVHVPTIEQKKYNDFATVWSDLEITYNTMVLQHPVTFVNDDGAVLEVQYVNEGEYAVDPTTRSDNPIATPTKESTVSTNYTFVGWNNPLTSQIFAALTVTAVYSEAIREYTIKYVSKSASGTVVKQETVGKYGENIPYDFEKYGIPTYTYEENAYNYYLFNRWDKSGFVDGDKTVTAIFDSFKYTGASSFAGKDIGDLKPVELYALTKLTESGKTPVDFGMSIEVADPFSFTMGYDIDFDDIESVEVISEKRTFTGAVNDYYDTGIKLFNEDRDFVLALDYTISKANTMAGTLMQCFQTSGSNGFKLGYDSNAPEFIWGSSTSIKPSATNSREMLVIRHKKGDNNLYVYTSNLDNAEPLSYTIEKSTTTQTTSDNATLIFGAAKMDSGRITNYCAGDVHWCKIWYMDLGEKVCSQLVSWTHEDITLGVSGFYRYPLYDNRSKETMVSLVASHLLDRQMKYNATNTNTGGWAESDLNKFLNSRFYNAIPIQIKLLLKKMCVLSTIGQKSSEVSESGCYINIPSVYDVDNTATDYKKELYEAASTIQSMSTQQNRRREFRYGFGNDNVDAYESYWLRSPEFTESYSTNYYVWCVNENYQTDTNKGTLSSVNMPSSTHGVVIEISF